MTAVAKTDQISVHVYYVAERIADEKSDYYQGEVFSMAGSTTPHSLIGTNLAGLLVAQLKGKPCGAYNSDQRIKCMSSSLRFYPDASVFCEPFVYDDEDSQKHTAINPSAIFEVLSESTAAYDRGFKFPLFQNVDSMRAFVFIEQKYAGVEVFERSQAGIWTYSSVSGRGKTIDVARIGITLDLADLYDRLDPEEIPDAPKPH